PSSEAHVCRDEHAKRPAEGSAWKKALRPHSSLDNQTPAEARRTLEQLEDTAPDALAQTNDDEYKKWTCRAFVPPQVLV
ncbi:MAG: hypothetical protein ABJF86_03210, partial [Tateyamaria sp.]